MILFFSVFAILDTVLYDNESMLNVGVVGDFSKYMSDDMLLNWMDWNTSVRQSEWDSYHGGGSNTVWRWEGSLHGLCYLWPDGTVMNTQDWYDLKTYEASDLKWDDGIVNISDIITMNFVLINQLGVLGTVIKFVVAGVIIYILVDVLWLG